MKTIWKQVIQPNSKRNDTYSCVIDAPRGAKPISVGLQGEKVCVWYECDPCEEKSSFDVYCAGTGFGSVPENCRFLGTVVDGPYVWHFYV